jgi:hypothetical protein
VAVEGDLVVVGAPGNDDNGSISGSAYVFERNGGVWGQAAKLTEGDAGDQLGNAVELSGASY